MSMHPFHLALPVSNLPLARAFYHELLACPIGRETDEWIDFNFYGHQLSIHLKPEEIHATKTNIVDGKQVPARHFGVVLPWDEWHGLVAKMQKIKIDFLIEPGIRFVGKVGEQATFFILDPSGNGLEFKSFKDMSQLFASNAPETDP